MGYNVQVAVDTAHHLIITHEVTNVGSDRAQLARMAKQTKVTLEAIDEDTRLTRVFTGRSARALRNRLIDEMGDAEALEFLAQASLTRPLLQANSDAARRAFLPLWAGQAAPLIRDLPAATSVDTLVAESRARLPSG